MNNHSILPLESGSRFAVSIIAILLGSHAAVSAEPGEARNSTLLSRPLSKVEALNIAIAHNGTLLQARKDVEAATGIAIQTRAVLFPHISLNADYSARQDSLIETNEHPEIPPIEVDGTVAIEGARLPKINNQVWATDIRIVQSLYEGGRMSSAARSARLIREQALLDYQSKVADALLSVANAYDDVLRDAKLVEVRDAQVKFLTAYQADTQKRFEAGTSPEFDVIRQEVEVANGTAQQMQALGDYRVAKQRFVEQLGFDLPTNVSDELSLNLTTTLEADPYPQTLSAALAQAITNRSEIAALEKEERLRDESIIVAKAGGKPSVQVFAGYDLTSRVLTRNAGDELHGGLVGLQMSWPIFDGLLTKGRIDEAVARRGKAAEAIAETTRRVQLQVRSAWSDLRTAKSVLIAQSENVRKAERALEIADARYKAGAGLQIDVLNAQTARTEARGSYVNALRDYSVARASLIRATGSDILPQTKPAMPPSEPEPPRNTQTKKRTTNAPARNN